MAIVEFCIIKNSLLLFHPWEERRKPTLRKLSSFASNKKQSSIVAGDIASSGFFVRAVCTEVRKSSNARNKKGGSNSVQPLFIAKGKMQKKRLFICCSQGSYPFSFFLRSNRPFAKKCVQKSNWKSANCISLLCPISQNNIFDQINSDVALNFFSLTRRRR